MTDPATRLGADHVYEALVDAGVDLAVGIPGRGSLPLDTRIADGVAMEYVLARHETAVPYIAWGYYEAGGAPAATITVPGPGDTNASNGLKNAAIDQVPMLHVSSEVPPAQRGKGAIHEIDPSTYDHVVKANVDVRTPAAVPESAARAVRTALSPPLGPVRLGMPFLGAEIDAAPTSIEPERVTHDNDEVYDRAAALLAEAERPVVYVGLGAKRSPAGVEGVRALVEALDAPVVGSYKGKGVFDETDDRWAGTSGHQLPGGAVRMLERADVVLALGAEFTGPTTRNWTLPMGERLVHVTENPDRLGVNYAADVPIVDDAGRAAGTLAERVEAAGGASGWDGAEVARLVRGEYLEVAESRGVFEDRSPAPTPAVIRSLRDALPDEAIVVADIAEFRTWALQLYPATHPAGFVVTDAWTSMGVGLPGAIGAKLAAPNRPVVALSGDGGFMMCAQELHTAAEYDLGLVSVVFNNAQYAMIDAAPELGGRGRYGFEAPDFEALAEAYGCGARTVETPSAAGEAVAAALETDRPELVNVLVDPEERSSMDDWGYESTVELP